MDPAMERRLEEVRRRAIPIPWSPPLQLQPGLPVAPPVMARAVHERLLPLIRGLQAADMVGCVHVARRLEHMLERVATASPELWIVQS